MYKCAVVKLQVDNKLRKVDTVKFTHHDHLAHTVCYILYRFPAFVIRKNNEIPL